MEQRREMTKKSKTSLRILQITLLILIFASFIPEIMNAGQMLMDEDESRVWGFAYSLFGVDWSVYMKQNSLVSFGYSVLLSPVIAVLQGRPGAIYKAAVLGNGVATCLSYLLLLYISSRLFMKIDKRLLSVLCAAVLFCPGFAAVRYAAVPDMMILLLFCIATACLVSMEEVSKSWKAVLFIIATSVGTWFHAGMIGVTIASFMILYRWYRTQRLREKTVFCLGLVSIFIVSSGFLIEKIWLYQIDSNTLLGLKGSMEVLAANVLEAWNSQGALKGIESILVKGFVLGLSTVVFIFPGIVRFIRRRQQMDLTIRQFLISAFLLTLCIISFYHVGIGKPTALADVRILMPYVEIFSISGVIYLLERKEKALWLSAGFFGLLSVFAYYALKNISIADTSAFVSILFTNVLKMEEGVLGGRLYLAALVVLVLFTLSVQLAFSGKKTYVKQGCQVLGLVVGIAGLSVINGFVFSQDVLAETSMRNRDYENILAALSEKQKEIPIFYVKEGKSQDDEIARLQYLCGKKQILLLDSKKQTLTDYEKKQILYFQEVRKKEIPFYAIVSVESPHIRRYAEEYRILELSDSYAVLTEKGNLAEQLSQEILKDRITVIAPNEELKLAPGTYEVTLETNENVIGEDGKVHVLEDGKVIKSAMIEFGQSAQGKAMVGVNFTSDTVLDDVNFELINSQGKEIPVQRVAYRKADVVYTVGINEEPELRNICEQIQLIDQKGFGKGTVGVIYDEVLGDAFNSLGFLKTLLEGYDIEEVQKEGKTSADYLICPTITGAYYFFMEDYSLIERNSGFVLMVRNKSERYESLASDGTAILSEGHLIHYQALVNEKDTISLERGNYGYIMELKAENMDTVQGMVLGEVLLKDGKKNVTSTSLHKEDFDENGQARIELVLNTTEHIKNLTYEIKSKAQVSIRAEVVGVELLSDKYQVGSEEEDGLKGLLETVNRIDQESRIYYVTSVKEREEQNFSLKQIQETVGNHPIRIAAKAEVKYSKEDCFLLLRNFSSSSMDLAKYYTMIAAQGDYSLWVSNHGFLMAKAMECGIGTLNSGERFPAALFQQDESMDENEIGPLKSGTYEASITIEGLEEEEQEQIVLQIVQRKSEKEINEDIDEVMKMQIGTGELPPEAMENSNERKRLREILGTEFVLESYEFLPSIHKRSGQYNVTVTFTVETTAEKISLKTVKNKNSKIRASIEWIQKTS